LEHADRDNIALNKHNHQTAYLICKRTYGQEINAVHNRKRREERREERREVRREGCRVVSREG